MVAAVRLPHTFNARHLHANQGRAYEPVRLPGQCG